MCFHWGPSKFWKPNGPNHACNDTLNHCFKDAFNTCGQHTWKNILNYCLSQTFSKMLYIAIKTLHLTQWNYPNGDQCEHDWTCCAMFASWFVSKTHSKFWHGRDNLLHIAAKIPACVRYYPHGNQCDHIVLCLHHGFSTQLILNSTMGETKCCI